MAYYGILNSATNTGIDSELKCIFATPLTIKSNQPAYAQDSMSLRHKAGSQGVQRWEITTNISQTSNPVGFLTHSVINGHAIPFYVRMPQLPSITPTTAAITLNGAHAAGAGTINILGASVMVPGEFITIGTDPKVYLVTTTGSAGTNIGIMPPLRRSQTGVSIATGAKVTMSGYYDTSVGLGITFTDGMLADQGSVIILENLQ